MNSFADMLTPSTPTVRVDMAFRFGNPGIAGRLAVGMRCKMKLTRKDLSPKSKCETKTPCKFSLWQSAVLSESFEGAFVQLT